MTDDRFQFRTLVGAEALAAVEAIGRLRIAIFREFPYLYEGSMEYERRYLQTYFRSPLSLVILVEHQGAVIGASTGLPASDAEEEVRAPLVARGFDPSQVFYCGEALLLPEYRGRGISSQFFGCGDRYARQIGAKWQTFITVVRPDDHPSKPPHYSSLDVLWAAQGFAKVEGLTTHMRWKDLGHPVETDHLLEYWLKPLL